jgi:hypothetical protein
VKALISAIALVLGSAAVFVIVRIQNDPFAFTRLEPGAKDVPVVAEPGVRIGITEVQKSVPESVTVWLEEIRIVGRASHAPRAAPIADEEPEVTVLPAPCNDGEYRLIDETRGVRLSCNVGP